MLDTHFELLMLCNRFDQDLAGEMVELDISVKRFLEGLKSVLEALGIALWLYDPALDTIQMIAVAGLSEDYVERGNHLARTVPPPERAKTPVFTCFHSQAPSFVTDLHLHPLEVYRRQLVELLHYNSLYLAPIVYNGFCGGVLVVYHPDNQSLNKQQLLDWSISAANRFGIAYYQYTLSLHNAHLIEERVHLRVQEEVARRAAQEREQILMQVVHDLRSDLQAIRLTSDRLAAASSTRAAAAAIQHSLSRIERLVAEKSRWIKESRPGLPSPLNMALEGALSTIAVILAKKQQELDLELLDEDVTLPLSITEMEQVLFNLLGNASKFAPAASTIALRVRRETDCLKLSIEDHGPGMPAKSLPEVLARRAEDQEAPGEGFGLKNVQAIVEKVGGRLGWHNVETGAVVEVSLPLLQAMGENDGLRAVSDA